MENIFPKLYMCAKICKRNANSGCRASSQPRTYPRMRDNIHSVTVLLFVFFYIWIDKLCQSIMYYCETSRLVLDNKASLRNCSHQHIWWYKQKKQNRQHIKFCKSKSKVFSLPPVLSPKGCHGKLRKRLWRIKIHKSCVKLEMQYEKMQRC